METQTPPAVANPAQLDLIQRKLQLDNQIRNEVAGSFGSPDCSLPIRFHNCSAMISCSFLD